MIDNIIKNLKNMFNFNKKYTDEENLLRDSVGFDVSDEFLKNAVFVERSCIGKKDEHTTVLLKFDIINREYPEFVFDISREQHDELVERFRIIHDI